MGQAVHCPICEKLVYFFFKSSHFCTKVPILREKVPFFYKFRPKKYFLKITKKVCFSKSWFLEEVFWNEGTFFDEMMTFVLIFQQKKTRCFLWHPVSMSIGPS